MSMREGNRPIDRDTMERLLCGDPAVRSELPRLASLLAAVTAPAAGRELAGEDAAVAAFAAVRLDPVPSPRRISMLKSTLAKLLTVKVAAAFVAIGGVGGVALAASSGTLPNPLPNPLHGSAPHPSVSASHSPRPHPSGTPSARPSHEAPPPELAKLCKKYVGRPGAQRRHALDEPEFGKLVASAGHKDRDRVDQFCAHLPQTPPSGVPSGPPAGPPSGIPTGTPHGKPSLHPSDPPGGGEHGNPGPRPTVRPSGAPSSHRSVR
jgi:hypothetical protein